ncbi:MAG TPA: dTDP-4-dehydrorhamnose 3,5-epimerase family protein [Polyangia bacterium]|jgi:dTDP-4-dehydrorhamnose 3,5-epimerase
MTAAIDVTSYVSEGPSPQARESSTIKGVFQISLRSFRDDRGYFFESYRRQWVPGAREMIQGNASYSQAGVLRGLHYHLKQADLWIVPSGLIRAVLYDCRVSSPTRGASEVHELGTDHPLGLYIPKGVAHGYYAVVDTVMTYMVDEYYDNTDEMGILWNDPALNLSASWGATAPVVSGRDRKNLPLASIPSHLLPP